MAERSLCRHAPKVGAECLNWARSDLCGGRGVIPIPTAIEFLMIFKNKRHLLWSGQLI
jgi:hypothetical protein